MIDFLRIIAKSLLLPLAILPFAIGAILIGGTIDINFPFVDVGTQLLRHMPLFFAIGLALSTFRAPRVVIILGVVIGYVLVVLAVQGVLMGLTYLAEQPIITEQWQTYAIIAGAFVVCYLIIFILVRLFELRRSDRRKRRSASASQLHPHDAAPSYVYALGGQDNIVALDNCATRLLVTVNDSALVDDSQLMALGVKNVVKPSETAVQVTIGSQTGFIAGAIRDMLQSSDDSQQARAETKTAVQKAPSAENGKILYDPAVSASVLLIIKALGGIDNIVDAGETAATRLRVVVRDAGLVDEDGLRAAGASGVMALGNTFHILLGIRATAFSEEMQMRLAGAHEEKK